MRGKQALDRLKDYPQIKTVLDIGAWDGVQTKYLRKIGFDVTSLDYDLQPDKTGGFQVDIVGDYLTIELDDQYDCVWCSHTLEHQANVGIFLKKLFKDTKDGGVVAITVPSMTKYVEGWRVVDGHLTYWNAGVLLYNMIVAGFDCSNARVGFYNDEISVLVEKKQADLPVLTSGRGELDRLNKFFPIDVYQSFNGHIESVNW